MRVAKRRISTAGRVMTVVAAITALAVVAGGVAVAVLRLRAPLPEPDVRVTTQASLVLTQGTRPAVPVPSGGSFVLKTSGGTTLGALADTASRPIGSVAKVMTALVVLQAHPLAAGEDGPALTLTAQDETFYADTVAAGGSAVPVQAGESLSERQLLQALLLPSANNIAETLAVWTSGSVDAFVARENTEAQTRHLEATHFEDPTGVSAGTVSSADDLVALARAALTVPALADVVRTQTATLPDGTVLRNLDIMLSRDGDWIGLKTGWTGAAGGCLLFAAQHTYASGAPPLTVLGAALGQQPDAGVDADHPELGGAFAAARDSVAAAFAGYAAVDLAGVTPSVSGSVSEPWGAHAAVAARPLHATAVVAIGDPMALETVRAHPGPAPPRGAVVAYVRGTQAGGASLSWPVVTVDAVAGPSWWWHLINA
jgi:D-alanyl-D-alanine carboxypeptidase (penicillin-binding protein 5/6)